MGQQQLLLIVMGLVIIGIAIAVSFNLFESNAANHKRDLLISECMNLAAQAQVYYKRPRSFGGGSHSYLNWQIPDDMETSENGIFSAEVTAANVVITGTGTEVITGSDSIKVQVTVDPYTTTTTIIN